MANLKFIHSLILVFTLTEIFISSTGDCTGDLANLASQCAQFVQILGPPVAPDAGCCSAVQAADLPCVCSDITKAVEGMISMLKVVFIAKSCQRPLSSGSKCGSYVVPMA